MTFCRRVAVVLGLCFGLGLPLSAIAQDGVLQGVGVRVEPGKMDSYLSTVKKLQGVMKRLKVDSNLEVWQVTAGGSATGNTFVGIEYPNLVAYAEGTTRSQADGDYQELIGGLDKVRTLQSTNLYRQVWGSGRVDVPTGSVIQSVTVRVKPGRLDDYVAKIEKLRKVSERLGSSSTMRIWQATAAGEATGNLGVGVIYKDLATYAADTTKIQSDPEWQKILAGLDDMRTVLSTVLARNVGP